MTSKERDAFCRTCMCQFLPQVPAKRYNIFEEPNLAAKLSQCIGQRVRPEDQYPNYLCEKCYEKVKDAYTFRITSRQALKEFKEFVSLFYGNVDDSDKTTINMPREPLETSVTTNACDNGTRPLDKPMEYITYDKNYIYDMLSEEGNVAENKENVSILNGHDVINAVWSDTTKQVDNNENYMFQADYAHMPANLYEEPVLDAGNYYAQQVDPSLSNNFNEETAQSICFEEPFLSEEGGVEASLYNIDESMLEGNAENTYASVFEECSSKNGLTDSDDENTYVVVCDDSSSQLDTEKMWSYACASYNCDFACFNLKDLQQHMKEHEAQLKPKYKCQFENCGQTYTSIDHIISHIDITHSKCAAVNVPWECIRCCVTCPSAGALLLHMRLHEKETEWPFVCDVPDCAETFREVAELEEHKHCHKGMKPYQCHQCNQRFYTAPIRDAHVAEQHRQVPHSCVFCQEVFETHSNLTAHMRSKHKSIGGVGQFICRICEKVFSSAAARKGHESTHSMPREYKCLTCSITFSTHSALKNHKMIHRSDLGNFECDICGIIFQTKNSLMGHKRKHANVKIYKCNKCSFEFKYFASYAKHISELPCQD